jgi:hypothetical protein
MMVTIDGVWIGNLIYWTFDTIRDYTLQITVSNKLLSLVTFFILLATASNGGRFSWFPNSFHASATAILGCPAELSQESLSTH